MACRYSRRHKILDVGGVNLLKEQAVRIPVYHNAPLARPPM
jgi:hypothetical protein